MEMYLKRMKDEWVALVEQTDPHIRRLASEIAIAHAHALSIEFYRIVLADPHAEEFLSNEQVERQLKSALEKWIVDVLSSEVDNIDELIKIQHTVAEVHARIGIPVELVEMGFRVLKKILYPIIIDSHQKRHISCLSTTSPLTVLIWRWKSCPEPSPLVKVPQQKKMKTIVFFLCWKTQKKRKSAKSPRYCRGKWTLSIRSYLTPISATACR